MSGRPLRIVATFHHPYYTPLHVTHRLGAFEREDLAVTIDYPRVGSEAQPRLLRDEADVAVGGPIRAFVGAELTPPQRLLSIAEVNSRDGFFLLARRPAPAFRWSDLAGRRLITFHEAPTPWLTLQGVLRRHGVDPAAVEVVRGLPTPEALAAFARGEADYVETIQPMAEELLESGGAHLAAAMGAHVGHIAYSSLVVAPAFRDARPELCAAVVRALARAQRWMAAAAPAEIARLVAADFPDIPPPRLTRIVERYQAMGSWPAGPVVAREGIERLGAMLVEAGFIRHAAPFESIVDNTFAEAAVRGLTGGSRGGT